MHTPHYQAETHKITVQVRTAFLEEHSNPEAEHYVWGYHITILNGGDSTVQLLTRTWLITNNRGEKERVHGAGVVGEQPILKPGESYAYSSGTPLATPSGFMEGVYTMVNEKGEQFDITIPAFSLDSPYEPSSSAH